MGRKSKLTPEQWAEVERRLIEGESRRALGREFGISEAAIRERFAGPVKDIQQVAQQIVQTEAALAALPPIAQLSAHNLAQKLRAISENLASAAYFGAASASRLSELAHAELGKVKGKAPMDQHETLKGVAALGRMANEAASLPMALVTAQKEQVKKANAAPMETRTLDTTKLSSQALRELMQARGG